MQNVEHTSEVNPAAGMKTVWSLPTVTTRGLTLGTAAVLLSEKNKYKALLILSSWVGDACL
jgi:hypothetical protein